MGSHLLESRWDHALSTGLLLVLSFWWDSAGFCNCGEHGELTQNFPGLGFTYTTSQLMKGLESPGPAMSYRATWLLQAA